VTANAGALASDAHILNGLPHFILDVNGAGLGSWSFTAAEADIATVAPDLRSSVTIDGASHQRLNPDAVDDLLVVCHFSAA
jgi:hypothetical protein